MQNFRQLWDRNINAPRLPSDCQKKSSLRNIRNLDLRRRPHLIKTTSSVSIDSLDYALPGVGGVADAMLGFGSKTLDFAANAPEAIWDVARGQSPDEELGAFYGRDVRDNATARFIEGNPLCKGS